MLGFDNPIHLLFLLVLLLLVFGAKRLPEMGRSLGSGMRGFKESLSGETSAPAVLEPSRLASVAEPASAPAESPAAASAESEPARTRQ
jgi:sec-independent protein translocase protein TatA